VGLVAVDHGSGRELVIAVLAVQALSDAAVVFLSLQISLAVLEENALTRLGGLFPVVAVIGVEMSLVEGLT
jgi:hypothetical protein